MDHFHTLAAEVFAKIAHSTNTLQIFEKKNLIFTSICVVGFFGPGLHFYMWTSPGKKKCDMSNTKAPPVDLPEPVSVFPPGMQIGNVIKEWGPSAWAVSLGSPKKEAEAALTDSEAVRGHGKERN
jgi:hypothetical protein